VFFSYSKAAKIGDKMKIKGTVKSHRDTACTQLNRVKVIDNI